MNNTSAKTHAIAAAAIIGAGYAALTMLLAPFSYGPLQFRVSEVLCILPFFIPASSWGLFLGCAVANILTGNIMDVVFGSLATLAAALVTAKLGKREHSLKNSALACLMPVLFNAVVIGAVITCAYDGLNLFSHFSTFLMYALYVGLGEAGVLFLLGLPLMRSLEGKKFMRELQTKINGSKKNE